MKPKGTPPQARYGHTMNALRNLLIIFGGINNKQEYLNDTAIYNSISNEWYMLMEVGWCLISRVRFHEHGSIMLQL